MNWRGLYISIFLLSLGLLCQGSLQARPIPVAAAADLQFALPEIARDFQRQHDYTLRLSFGSSGHFVTQIQQGAPFELFLSADESYVHQLHRQGLALDAGKRYATGRLVLWAPFHSPLHPSAGLKGLYPLLAQGKIRHFALAHPLHAPYGRAAREALLKAGLWSKLQGHLVLGENASQAAQFASSGSAEGGILPLSLALAPALRTQGHFSLIPADWHSPLHQRMVLLKRASPGARAFYHWIQGVKAQQILIRYGFTPPGSRL